MVVTAMLYAPTLRFPAVYEDLNDPETFFAAPTLGNFAAMVRHHPTRALTELSFDVNRVLAGPANLVGYHAGSVALHLVNVLIVGLIAWQIAPPVGAMAVASIFAVHPLNVEAVAYVSARAELVAASGVLLALLAASLGSFAGALCGILLACLGKETAVMAWGLVPLWAWASQTAFPTRKWLLTGCALGVVVIAAVLLRITPGIWPVADLALIGRTSAAVLRMVTMWFTPIGLSIDHDWHGVPLWLQSVSVGLLVSATAGALWRLQRGPTGWAVAWIVTLLWCLPRFVMPTSEGLHEHHFYLLTAVWSLCAGAWLSRNLVRAGV